MTDKIERMEYPADPDRCQGVGLKGQCTNKRYKESKYCIAHGGNKAESAAKKRNAFMYRIQSYQQRAQELNDDDALKSLRNEIALLRVLVEERFNACQSDTDLILQSHAISELITKVSNTVQACHKIETSMGSLLDKTSVLAFAQAVVAIISEEIEDEDLLRKISERIEECLT